MKKRTFAEVNLIDITQNRPFSKRRRTIPEDPAEESKIPSNPSYSHDCSNMTALADAFGTEQHDEQATQQLIDNQYMLEENKVSRFDDT